MRFVLLIGLIGLAIAVGLGVVAAPSKGSLASLDPHHPATLFLNIESGLRAFGSAATELVRGLVNEFTSPYRERIRHSSPTPSPPR
jgi:hypothetical protein